MRHPRVCHGPTNQALYRAFWILLILVLCLGLSLAGTVSFLLQPKILKFIEDDAVVIILDLSPLPESDNDHVPDDH